MVHDVRTTVESTLGKFFPQGKMHGVDDNLSGRWRVLVADDEHVIADTLAAILNGSGFEAKAVYSGIQAVDIAGVFEPDIFLSDVMMPGITGIEAAIAIQVVRPSCKVLLFSGQAATVDLLHETKEQRYVFDILEKPIHPADLLARLRPIDFRETGLRNAQTGALASPR